jgi:hypothetical protein
MRLPIDQKIVCQIEEGIIINILKNIDENDYPAVGDYRNKIFGDVKSIPIFHSTTCGNVDNKISSIEKKSGFKKFHPLIVPILDELKKYYDYNYHASVIANLKPGGRIYPHCDCGEFLERCHRVHVPLKTNKGVVYWIAGENYYWEMGNIYEFDNTLIHGVFNGSDQERIHLILNLYNLSEEEMTTLNKI